MEKELNPVMTRLSAFADKHGGFAGIGRKIGKHPAMFYNLVRRNAMPSLATLQEIAEAYPEMDLNFIIRGKQHDDIVLIKELREKVSSYESALLKTINLPAKSFHKSEIKSPGGNFNQYVHAGMITKDLSGNRLLITPRFHS